MSQIKAKRQAQTNRLKRLQEYQLGVSGWRAIFSATTIALSFTDKEIFMVAASVIGDFFVQEFARLQKKNPSRKEGIILMARDSRATGVAILSLFTQTWQKFPLQKNAFTLKPVDIGIQALPQVASHVQSSANIYFYVYISASHNPPEYNGIKIGNAYGEVLPAIFMQKLIARFKKKCTVLHLLHDKQRKLGVAVNANQLNASLQSHDANENNSTMQSYTSLMDKVAFTLNYVVTKNSDEISRALYGYQQDLSEAFKRGLQQELAGKNYAIACDYNGSARLLSAERNYLHRFAIGIEAINTDVGSFAHRIVPEGSSLDELKAFMQKKQATNLLFGYMPDCDGDRGNVVLYDGNKKNVFVPEAQTTFALALTSELAFDSLLAEMFRKRALNDDFFRRPVAVVVNDATSIRAHTICECFGAKLFIAEVGEANVLALAKQKINEGYRIRFVGEGSNGGNITFPSTVRDPLSTLLSLIKLLFLKYDENFFYDYVLYKLGVRLPQDGDATTLSPQEKLFFLQKSLDWYTTTSIFEEEALIRFKITQPAALLKRKYEKKMKQIFAQKKNIWKKKYGFVSYEIINYEGVNTLTGEGNRTGSEDGGFKVLFRDRQKKMCGFFWMRGSRTEPVFRIAVDVRSNVKEHHDDLLNVHQKIVLESSL